MRNFQEEDGRFQHGWDSIRKSNTGRSNCQSVHFEADQAHSLQPMDASSRNLSSSIQLHQPPSSCWKIRTNNLAVMEIIRDRQAAIESGRLKGRQLVFDKMDGATASCLHGNEELCNTCSSALIHGSDIRSLFSRASSTNDDDGHDYDHRHDGVDHDDGYDHGHGLSVSSSLCVEKVERKKMVDGGRTCGSVVGCGEDGGKWMVRMEWVALVLMGCALGIITWMNFDGMDDGEKLIPT